MSDETLTADAAAAPAAPVPPGDKPLLEVRGLEVAYGDAKCLFGVDFSVNEGGVLAVLGPNGAGKSSLAGAIAGLVKPKAGSVHFDGKDITGLAPYKVRRRGIAFVPEGRGIFPNLSVLDNLRVLLRAEVPRSERSQALERVYGYFPVLAQRRNQAAGTLSGGEQQMLTLSRVLAKPPRLLIADEMSLGLAPLLVDNVFEALEQARAEHVTIVLIEQYVERALAFADDAIVLQRGKVGWRGPASEGAAAVIETYLG
ncbi:MAG: transporter related protein [Actinomycetia bacterium]|nr:transporter related protein [Actinomycetes bacterium]